MHKVEIAIALVRSTVPGSLHWLVKHGQSGRKPGFIIGQRLENESFRDTIKREVAWELGLDRKRDFLVSSMAQINSEFVDRLPGHLEESHVLASFYNVEVYRSQVLEQLDADRSCFWVDSGEVCDGVTRQGQILDPIVPYLINRSSAIQHWESQES